MSVYNQIRRGVRSQVVSSELGLTQELSLSRISDSTTGYTFTPCVGFLYYPSIDTRHWAFSVSSKRHRQMWGEQNCISFETVVGGIEPPSPQLTVGRSTA